MQNVLSTLRHRSLSIIAGLVVLAIILLIGFSVVYGGKIYPGVSVDGLYLGGLTKAEATTKLQHQATAYKTEQLPVQYNRTTLRIPVGAIGASYDAAKINDAYNFGRHGGRISRITNRFKSMFGRKTTYAAFTYDDAKLTPFLEQVDTDVTTPVANAALTFSDGEVAVAPSRPGNRLDRGYLTELVNSRLAAMSTQRISAPVYSVVPTITDNNLAAVRHQADKYAQSPLDVSVAGLSKTVGQDKLLSWLDVTAQAGRTELPINVLYQFYDDLITPEVNLSFNQLKVGAYVATLAGDIDQQPKNAVLAMQDGTLKITQASQTGKSVDQPAAVKQIMTVLKSGDTHKVTLAAKTTEAEVNESNLESLGIKEQISEGQTFFPGSTSARMTNVRVGAALYNGVLLKPGEVFSFGKILGDVGPAQGYLPELVILGDHEEKQYGGGLCQVASTAYRAALLAGLPILERHNHSFAVSYYTAPYGVPGVDATIYYPQVDFKFKNDTGHYILIQTVMKGTTLTFDYFGTKTKVGEIRGPEFISGSTDAKQPSRTVFYRDIKDMSGALIKTDAVYTNYQSSANFPITQQFN